MVSVGERLGLIAKPDFEMEPSPTGTLVTRTSIFTQKRNTMDLPIPASAIERYRNEGGLVQDHFPQLDADQREFILSGATPEEWNGIFPEEEE